MASALACMRAGCRALRVGFSNYCAAHRPFGVGKKAAKKAPAKKAAKKAPAKKAAKKAPAKKAAKKAPAKKASARRTAR